MSEIRCPLCENEDEPCLYCAVAEFRKNAPKTNKENVYRKTQALESRIVQHLNKGDLDKALAIDRFLASIRFTKHIVLMAYVNRQNNVRRSN